MSKEIGEKIKHLRKTRKMSQEELGEKVGIKRSTISNYEIGRRTPHLKDLQKLAEAFGVGLEYFNVVEIDNVFDLLARAKAVFESPAVPEEEKEKLYREFMVLYLNMKASEAK